MWGSWKLRGRLKGTGLSRRNFRRFTRRVHTRHGYQALINYFNRKKF